MNLKVLSLAAAAAMLGLQPATASAHADVVVGLQIGIPVASYYYDDYAPARVYYERRAYPRRDVYWVDHDVRYCKHKSHGRGWRKGHRRDWDGRDD